MPTPDRVLLDTHALVWWKADAGRLSPSAVEVLGSARQILISPISFWETAMLVAKGRVRLDRPTRVWARDVLAEDRSAPAELDSDVAVLAAELPAAHGDPADRILMATARLRGVALLSKDRVIRDQADGELRVLW